MLLVPEALEPETEKSGPLSVVVVVPLTVTLDVRLQVQTEPEAVAQLQVTVPGARTPEEWRTIVERSSVADGDPPVVAIALAWRMSRVIRSKATCAASIALLRLATRFSLLEKIVVMPRIEPATASAIGIVTSSSTSVVPVLGGEVDARSRCHVKEF